MKRLLISGSIAGLLALAACGGGASSSPPAAAKAVAGSSGTLAFTIAIPAATAASATTRRPAYVSPATNSVAFQVGSGTPQVVAVTPGSAACPLVSGFYTCTADVSAAAGSGQHLTVTTYASTNGTGTALSTNTLVVNVIANQSNPVTVTLNGIAASFALSAMPAMVTTGTASSIVVTYSALDASGNTIIGPGSIINAAGNVVAPALASSNTSAFSIGALSGNSWTVNYNGAATASPVTFTVSNTGVTSANAMAVVTSGAQNLFVANVTGTTNNVEVYTPPYTGAPTVVTSGLTSDEAPFYVAVGSSGDLFVPSAAGVQIYAPPYTGAPTTIAIAGGTNQVTLDASGNLFSANANNTITEYAPPYTGAAAATISTGVSSPETMAVDNAGDLFVTNVGNDSVTAYVPPYTAAPTVMAGAGCPPTPCFQIVGGQIGVVPSTHNTVFTSDGYGSYLYDAPWTAGPAATIQYPASASYDGAWGLAFDSSNDLFISYTASNSVAEYAPPYTAGPAVTITNGVSQPRGITVDRSNNLFVTNINGTVTEYAPPYTAAPVTTITADTGGAYPYDVKLSP